MERIARAELPEGMTFEWTDLTYQEKTAGNAALYVFPIAVLLAFLILAAQYNSWTLPLAVLLIVPMCRSEEHTSELQSLMRISYAVFCLKKTTQVNTTPK